MIKLFSGQCKTVGALGLFSNIISQRQTKSQREVWVLRNAKMKGYAETIKASLLSLIEGKIPGKGLFVCCI